MLKIDGSYGEGGGQIIRTALTLACITSTPVEIENIRANRGKPGLRPQHETCVQAAADLCDAEVMGGHTGSERLVFRPGRTVRAGQYQWDIGTAGAATLVMQTVLLPLILADGESIVEVHGGTHVPFSPSAHYLRDVYAPMLVQSEANVIIQVNKCGFAPQGGGEIVAEIKGRPRLKAQQMSERGELERIFGSGLASNLPSHIPQRMTDRTTNGLKSLEVPLHIRPVITKGISTGAGVFITAEYEGGRAGFGVLGERGMPSEEVADNAVTMMLRFDQGAATVDEHLADQLLLILALAHGESQYITPEITSHLETNRWVIQQFIERDIQIDHRTGLVKIAG